VSRGNVRVRAAGLDDLDAFLELSAELDRITGGCRGTYPRLPLPCTAGTVAERYSHLLDDPDWRLIFAVDDGTDLPLGMAVLARDNISAQLGAPAVYLSHLVVSPAHRRRGAGRALVKAATTYADELACEHVIVGVTIDGREAHRFFARLGFAPLVTRRVASVTTLRRKLGVAQHPMDISAQVIRRRIPRTPRTARLRRLRGGGVA
jgi:GNAT superfamily N-acetyltransferase